MTGTATARDLVRVRVERVDLPRLAWAEGEQVSIPREILESTTLGGLLTSRGSLTIPASVAGVGATASHVREQAAFTDTAPASSRLPFSYQLVPGPVRAMIAGVLGRRQRQQVDRWARFPGFPLDLTADFLADLESAAANASARPAPVLLSHDIDSPEGLRNLVRDFLPLEEAAGARSVNFIVPCAWPVDAGLVAEIRERGHEVGVHGFDHANRTPFVAEDERLRRIDGAADFARRHGARGYRAPSLLRTRALLRALPRLYEYDSSIPTSGGLFPTPNNGCASARVFRIEGITEIPVSMPRDGSLRFLGYTPSEIVQIWRDCALRIARSRGVVMLLTHCERRFSGTPAMREVYGQFLTFVRETAGLTFDRASTVAAAARQIESA